MKIQYILGALYNCTSKIGIVVFPALSHYPAFGFQYVEGTSQVFASYIQAELDELLKQIEDRQYQDNRQSTDSRYIDVAPYLQLPTNYYHSTITQGTLNKYTVSDKVFFSF